MTMTRIALALALALGTAQAAESIKPQRGETMVSFQCRAAHLPEIRQCTQACEVSPDADTRWDCIHACTTHGLWTMAQCREAGASGDPAVAFR